MRLSRADVSSRGCCRDEVIGPSFVSATSYEITEQKKNNNIYIIIYIIIYLHIYIYIYVVSRVVGFRGSFARHVAMVSGWFSVPPRSGRVGLICLQAGIIYENNQYILHNIYGTI